MTLGYSQRSPSCTRAPCPICAHDLYPCFTFERRRVDVSTLRSRISNTSPRIPIYSQLGEQKTIFQTLFSVCSSKGAAFIMRDVVVTYHLDSRGVETRSYRILCSTTKSERFSKLFLIANRFYSRTFLALLRTCFSNYTSSSIRNRRVQYIKNSGSEAVKTKYPFSTSRVNMALSHRGLLGGKVTGRALEIGVCATAATGFLLFGYGE